MKIRIISSIILVAIILIQCFDSNESASLYQPYDLGHLMVRFQPLFIFCILIPCFFLWLQDLFDDFVAECDQKSESQIFDICNEALNTMIMDWNKIPLNIKRNAIQECKDTYLYVCHSYMYVCVWLILIEKNFISKNFQKTKQTPGLFGLHTVRSFTTKSVCVLLATS
mgnify:CR=1 FL=1